jgi:hypothetical protein
MRARLSLRLAAGSFALVTWASAGALAHKPITSPFTFYEDVLPITAAQCGVCHSPEGIAPMSLLTHEGAVPWGESMRLELMAGHMPPWNSAAPQDRFRDRRRLSARELNILLTWASGGTPPGEMPRAIDPGAATWPLGTPHETLTLPAADLPADVARATRESVLTLARYSGRRLSGVDLQPGLASVVRSARISVRPAGGGPERVVGLWVPGDQPALLPAGSGWSVEADSELVVRVSYRKRWDRERDPASDQSTVGLYFAAATANEAGTLALPGGRAAPVTAPMRVVALWPEPAAAGARLRIETVASSGARAHVATLSPRAGWERRYWFTQPLELAAGTALEVIPTWPAGATPAGPDTTLLTFDVLPD